MVIDVPPQEHKPLIFAASGVASIDNWEDGWANIHISCSALLISFEIDCFY